MFNFLKIIIVCIIINNTANSQIVHTINYTTSGLPTSSSICNVFNMTPAHTVGGFEHWPVSGGATFDGTNLKLQTQYAFSPTSSNLGTAYAIKIPFQAGHSYSFQFTTK